MQYRSAIPILFLFILGLSGCRTQEKTNETHVQLRDSLVDFHTEAIQKYYAQTKQNGGGIALELKGRRALENDSIVILSFDEIEQFGSWHYANSALFFIKEKQRLVAVTASPAFSANGLRLVDGIAYPNKIHGSFKEMKDLTGDGVAEFLFLDSRSYHDEVEERLSIYQFNKKDRLLVPLNVEAFSHGTAAGDTLLGTIETLRILKNHDNQTITAVKHDETARNGKGRLMVVKTHTVYYRYDAQKGFVQTDFEGIESK